MPTIVLWDIDNTLLYTGGAGSLGMARAFRDLYGVDDAFRGVEFSGRADAAIFTDAALAHGIAADAVPEELPRFIAAYVDHLRVTLVEAVGGRVMPGVMELLGALAQRHEVRQGLGTGNFRRGAELKIRHYALDRYFQPCEGGFGEDSQDRAAVIACGIERLRNGDTDGGPIVVIGDTPHDVTAARANGAYALAVATGRDSVEELLSAGADAALADLSDCERALDLIEGAAAATR